MQTPEPETTSEDPWASATWEGARRQHLLAALSATPAQRLAWLEEMIAIAWEAGALGNNDAGRGMKV